MANLPHVVIIGAGFGGLAAAKALANAPVRGLSLSMALILILTD